MAEQSDFVIYHDADCRTSRNALALLRRAGVDPRVVEYLKTPLRHAELEGLIAFVGLPTRDIMREGGTPFNELGLGAPGKTHDGLIAAMVDHPILLNRPIVATENRAMLCRPSDTVLDLLGSKPTTNIDREGGTPFLSDREIVPDDELEIAMEGAGLPIDDLVGPNRTYYRYSRLDGEVVGYGGFELYGQHALFRSLAVTRRFHRQGNGRNIFHLLTCRAFARGARTAFALPATTDSEAFMVKLGFAEIDRAGAPAAIITTRQASELCRAKRLFRRRIAL